jgi:hypothetical protein
VITRSRKTDTSEAFALQVSHALHRAFRLGAEPEGLAPDRLITVPRAVSRFLSDRSRAIAAVAQGGISPNPLRRVIAVSAYQAFRLGALPLRPSEVPVPDRRFREERPVFARDLSRTRYAALRAVARGERSPTASELPWMSGLGVLSFDENGEADIASPWREAVAGTPGTAQDALPSLSQLATPTKAALRAVDPTAWVGGLYPGITSEPLTGLTPLLRAAEGAASSGEV